MSPAHSKPKSHCHLPKVLLPIGTCINILAVFDQGLLDQPNKALCLPVSLWIACTHLAALNSPFAAFQVKVSAVFTTLIRSHNVGNAVATNNGAVKPLPYCSRRMRLQHSEFAPLRETVYCDHYKSAAASKIWYGVNAPHLTWCHTLISRHHHALSPVFGSCFLTAIAACNHARYILFHPGPIKISTQAGKQLADTRMP